MIIGNWSCADYYEAEIILQYFRSCMYGHQGAENNFIIYLPASFWRMLRTIYCSLSSARGLSCGGPALSIAQRPVSSCLRFLISSWLSSRCNLFSSRCSPSSLGACSQASGTSLFIMFRRIPFRTTDCYRFALTKIGKVYL